MFIAEIWRYPVKSMGGERLARARLAADGVEGDRGLLVRSAGRVVTARTRPGLLGLRARLGPAGEPEIDGLPWRDAEIARRVEELAGKGAALERVRAGEARRFDVLPLLVATDGALAAAGTDSRRFRPNLIIGGVPGLAERGWEGGRLRVGKALLQVHDLRARCVMITYDPDTQAQEPAVLRRIVEEYEGVLGLNCAVLEGGEIAEGDACSLL